MRQRLATPRRNALVQQPLAEIPVVVDEGDAATEDVASPMIGNALQKRQGGLVERDDMRLVVLGPGLWQLDLALCRADLGPLKARSPAYAGRSTSTA
jgi:hypothetical protein